jgi:hypothetical protein
MFQLTRKQKIVVISLLTLPELRRLGVAGITLFEKMDGMTVKRSTKPTTPRFLRSNVTQ